MIYYEYKIISSGIWSGYKRKSGGGEYNMVENKEVNIYARIKRNIR